MIECKIIISYVSFSGAEVLTIAGLLRTGKMTRDYRQPLTKGPILKGDEVIPINSWCQWCRTECYKAFEGKVLMIVGLNNALHASEKYNLEWMTDRMASNQVKIKINRCISLDRKIVLI